MGRVTQKSIMKKIQELKKNRANAFSPKDKGKQE